MARRNTADKAKVALRGGDEDCWAALGEIAAIGARITDPNNVFGLQMANIASKAIAGRCSLGVADGKAAGSAAVAAALDGVAAAADINSLTASEVAKVARAAAEVVRRLDRELAVEKEESASYHRFWIEERDRAAQGSRSLNKP